MKTKKEVERMLGLFANGSVHHKTKTKAQRHQNDKCMMLVQALNWVLSDGPDNDAAVNQGMLTRYVELLGEDVPDSMLPL